MLTSNLIKDGSAEWSGSDTAAPVSPAAPLAPMASAPEPEAPTESVASTEAPDDPDDPWSGWTGCICGGGYYGQMVGCDGGCNDWFHFGCVGLKRQPRGKWICSACSAKSSVKKRPAEEERGRSSGAVRKKTRAEQMLSSSTEIEGRADLEELVSRARPLKFDSSGALLGAGDRQPSRPCAGAARLAPLAPEIFVPLLRLHRNIVAALRRGRMLQTWQGRGKDVRSRGFAFLPKRYGKFGKERLLRGGLHFHAAEKEGEEAEVDEAANWRSCLTLRDQDVDAKMHAALKELIVQVQAVVPERYRKFIELKHLMAIQPNLHNGAEHLPPHLDFPLHDGFGVVIVTIQMTGGPASVVLCRGGQDTASIVTTSARRGGTRGAPRLRESSRERCWTFSLRAGDAYVLSGDARNHCDHGVLCQQAPPAVPTTSRRSKKKAKTRSRAAAASSSVPCRTESRESLNLRFGLHPCKHEAELSAYKEVYHQFDLAGFDGQEVEVEAKANPRREPIKVGETVEQIVALAAELPPTAPMPDSLSGATDVVATLARARGLQWARVPGHPMWPSRPCTTREEAMIASEPHTKEDVCVCFLGANNFAWVKPTHRVPITTNPRLPRKKVGNNQKLKQGLREALQMCKDAAAAVDTCMRMGSSNTN